MLNRTTPLLLVVSLILAAGITAAAADNWPQWRGPHLNGTSTTTKNLPTNWSTTENVKWSLELPSWSAATPIIWGDTVLVTSAQEGFQQLQQRSGGGRKKGARRGGGGGGPRPDPTSDKDKMYLIAVNRADGAVRWSKLMGAGNRLHRKQNLASPSPVTDGKHIWTMTGAGTLTCFDFDGNQIWQRDIQKDYGTFGLNHGYANSPLLHKGRLYIQVLHGMKTDDPSYVFSVDTKTGRTLWKVERPTDATSESPDDYSTPVLATVNGKQQLVVSGGDYVTGHDLDSGKELWRMGGLNPGHERAYRTIASSIVNDDMVYTSSTRGRPFIAFHPGGSGDITNSNMVWKNDLGPDVPTPTRDGKIIYVINDRGIAIAFDAKTGDVVWDRKRIEPGTYSSSPILADGKIYATSEDGTTTVLKAGPEFEILAVNKLESHTLATPSPVGDEIFIRTAEHLYCIAEQ